MLVCLGDLLNEGSLDLKFFFKVPVLPQVGDTFLQHHERFCLFMLVCHEALEADSKC